MSQPSTETTKNDLKEAALEYHRQPTPGKLAIRATTALTTQRDLALAYSPGVAHACTAIVDDPGMASEVTARGNLVAVISNGTAVLGLGAIGPLASKPVMEGKAVLFKKFAGIDVFDIEVDETDPDKLVDIIASLEPTFGGVNLEDIKAPECFEVEAKCRERMNIPVFHDDQHGTAIIVAAAISNALELVGKPIDQVKLVTAGAGAAALACLDLLVSMGMPVGNITVTDLEGVVYEGRKVLMDPRKERYAQATDARTLGEAVDGADIFLGLSAAGVLKPEFLKSMAEKPVILALANPTPEIMPDEARAVRPDALIATGRSDFPNQVNNVLCFPFIFRGALDVGATAINEEMKIACVNALATLAKREGSDVVASAYGGQEMSFGPEYLIPKPFDPRLIAELAPAVAQAAMDTGVATKPITDMDGYRQKLQEFLYASGLTMKPVFAEAKANPKRIAYAEGEDDRVLAAVQQALDEGLCRPILIGRRAVVEARAKRAGLRFSLSPPGTAAATPDVVELVDPENDPRYSTYWKAYHDLMGRSGVSPDRARTIVRTNTTTIAALMVIMGEADSMICGTVGPYRQHLQELSMLFGLKPGIKTPASMSALILPKDTLFIADPYVVPDPDPEQLADITALAAEEIERFGIRPRVALVSSSNFGTLAGEAPDKMRAALPLIRHRLPELEVDGEMHADAAMSQMIRDRILPGSRLKGAANLLVCPGMDSANISLNLLKTVTDSVVVGPILMGLARPGHILTPSVTTRGILNVTALASVDAEKLGKIHGHRDGYIPRFGN